MPHFSRWSCLLSPVAAFLTVLPMFVAIENTARAQAWLGSVDDSNIQNGGNWSGGSVPGAGATATFGPSPPALTTTADNENATFSVGQLHFDGLTAYQINNIGSGVIVLANGITMPPPANPADFPNFINITRTGSPPTGTIIFNSGNAGYAHITTENDLDDNPGVQFHNDSTAGLEVPPLNRTRGWLRLALDELTG